MKKFLSLMMVLCMIFALTACKETTTPTDSSAKTIEESGTVDSSIVDESSANADSSSDDETPAAASTTESTTGEPTTDAPTATAESSREHVHDWKPVYKTVHHDAEYKTVHHDAEYETIYHEALSVWVSDNKLVGYMTCRCKTCLCVYIDHECVYSYGGVSPDEAWEARQKDEHFAAHKNINYTIQTSDDGKTSRTYIYCPICEYTVASVSSRGVSYFEGGTSTFDEAWNYHITHINGYGGECSGWSNGYPNPDTIPDYVKKLIEEASPNTSHIDPEQSHDAYYEKVLVKEAYDERVLVKAYDEQVVDYYECACGARK